jgi:hypothetical protein
MRHNDTNCGHTVDRRSRLFGHNLRFHRYALLELCTCLANGTFTVLQWQTAVAAEIHCAHVVGASIALGHASPVELTPREQARVDARVDFLVGEAFALGGELAAGIVLTEDGTLAARMDRLADELPRTFLETAMYRDRLGGFFESFRYN